MCRLESPTPIQTSCRPSTPPARPSRFRTRQGSRTRQARPRRRKKSAPRTQRGQCRLEQLTARPGRVPMHSCWEAGSGGAGHPPAKRPGPARTLDVAERARRGGGGGFWPALARPLRWPRLQRAGPPGGAVRLHVEPRRVLHLLHVSLATHSFAGHQAVWAE